MVTSDNVKVFMYASGALIAGLVAYKIFKDGKKLGAAVAATFDDISNGAAIVTEKAQAAVTGVFSPQTPSDTVVKIVKSLTPSVSAENVRENALAELNTRRTALAVQRSNILSAPFTLAEDLRDWWNSEPSLVKERDDFYSRNPYGIFYD